MMQLPPGLLSDEQQRSIGNTALLSAGLALLGNRSGRGLAGVANAASQGLGAYGQTYGAGVNNALQMRQLQEQMQARQAQQQQAQQLGQMFSEASTPQAKAEAYIKAANLAAAQGNSEAAKRYADIAQSLMPKEREGFTLSEGQQRFDANGKPVASVAAKPAAAPAAVQEYEFARSQGFRGSFADWEIAKRKAGSPSVNITNAMGKGFASEIAPMVTEARSKALGAIDQASAAGRILQAVDSGNVFTGPMATARLTGAQIADTIGLGGKDTGEKIANTRQAMQGLAQLVLAGRQQMRGQGAITESEGKLAERAMAGDINLTAGELRLLANAAARAGRHQYDAFQSQLGNMKADPNLAPMVPYYSVPEFPAMPTPPSLVRNPAAPAAGGGRLIFNPQTGRLEEQQ